jgi:hypothetical protein
MYQSYKEINFRKASLAMIDFMNSIIRQYTAQGFRLTVRQLYYQLVARAVIENTERSYKNITSLVNDARLAGLMSWNAIEDRTRDFIRRPNWDSGQSILNVCANQFHMDMWENQRTRVWVVVEKEALAGVLEGVCHELDVPLLAARGYPSGTVLREFAVEQIMPSLDAQQDALILHLGDHDPSGLDMTRDLEERIQMFSETECITLRRIALNRDQIDAYRPPPNPAKTTDARFADYRRRHGSESWELDALNPTVLADLVRANVQVEIDEDEWARRVDEIQDVKDRLIKIAEEFDV